VCVGAHHDWKCYGSYQQSKFFFLKKKIFLFNYKYILAGFMELQVIYFNAFFIFFFFVSSSGQPIYQSLFLIIKIVYANGIPWHSRPSRPLLPPAVLGVMIRSRHKLRLEAATAPTNLFFGAPWNRSIDHY
jgi:hypothetical protein